MTRAIRVNTGNSWAILRDIILRNTASRSESYITPIKGFEFHRQVSNADPKPHFYEPVIIVVVQGKKLVKIGAEEHQEVDPDLLDAFVRLAELTEKPEQILVMRDMLMREIHYRLLAGAFGNTLRSLNTLGSQGHQITKAIAWLKEFYKEPLLVEDLANRSHMAPSTFHKYFKRITTLSPLQYQKRLRLGEAQRLMLSEGYDVTQAAMAVGYESATQFIREYKRLFGDPPLRNVMSMKNIAKGAPQWAAM